MSKSVLHQLANRILQNDVYTPEDVSDFIADVVERNGNSVFSDELAYLQACAAAVEDLSRIDATDATIAMFFKRDAKKLAKMKVTK